MNKTEHFNLNKPEAADPLRLADFNQNADVIDAALGNLNTAVAACGNCRVAVGTYTGAGKFNSGNKNSLTFDSTPRFILISGYGYSAYLVNGGYSYTIADTGDTRALTVIWGTDVKWYSAGNSYLQMNHTTEYTYMAFFA